MTYTVSSAWDVKL